MLDRLGQLPLISEREAPVRVGFDRVWLDLKGLPVMLHRLGELPLISKRQAPVVVGFGGVRSHLQGQSVVFDRLGRLALLAEDHSPVVVGGAVVRLDVEGLPVVLDRLGRLALISAHPAQAELSHGSLGVNGQSMGPEFLRVVPDLDLVPAESSQAREKNDGEPGKHERWPSPPRGKQAGAGQARPSEACQVGIAISGNLRAALKDPEYRQEDHHVSHPRRRQARHWTAEGQDDRRYGENQGIAQDERRRHGIHRARQFIERREVHGHDHLPEVEAQAVRRDHQPAREAQLSQRGCGVDRRLRHDCNGRCPSSQQHERDLLDVDPPRGLTPPADGPPKASEGIDVQDQQDDRKIHDHRLREKRQDERGHGQPVPPSAALLSLAGPQVHQDRHQVEESREHIAPFGDPRHGFHAQGMDRKHEGGEPGGHSKRVTAFRGTGQSPCQDATDDEEEDHRVGGVQEEARQMIPDGIHAPEQVVQAEGHPRQRNVVALVRGPHPAEVGPGEAPIVRVVEEIVIIIKVHKLVLEGGQERSAGDESNHHRHQPPDPSLGRSADYELTRRWSRVVAIGGRSKLAKLAPAAHWCARNLLKI